MASAITMAALGEGKMQNLPITISSKGDDYSWSWTAETGSNPHGLAAAARDYVHVVDNAAVGNWPAAQVQRVLADLGRRHGGLPAAVFTGEGPQASAASAASAALAELAKAAVLLDFPNGTSATPTKPTPSMTQPTPPIPGASPAAATAAVNLGAPIPPTDDGTPKIKDDGSAPVDTAPKPDPSEGEKP